MTERSFESEWLDYVLANQKANRSYFAKMQRLHQRYTFLVARDVTNAIAARRRDAA